MQTLLLFLKLAKPYWLSSKGKFGWLLLALTIILYGLSTYCSIKFTQWNGDFFNALEQKNKAEIFYQIYYFIALLAIMSVIAVHKSYCLSWLKIHWRKYMSNQYTQEWLEYNHFYHISHMQNIDNIDQRISEDIALFIYTTLDLFFSFLSAVLNLSSFAIILWQLSGSLDFSYKNINFSISGYMLYGALLYALIGFLIAKIVGSDFKSLNLKQQQKEAHYRKHLMQIIEHKEAIAFANGAICEQNKLKKLFTNIYTNKKELMSLNKNYNIYTLCYEQAIFLPPLFLSLPRYLAGTINLGQFMQIRMVFARVVGSLSWFTESYAKLMGWLATIERIVELDLLLKQQRDKNNSIIRNTKANNLNIKNLTLTKPNFELIFSISNWSLNAGELCLIQNPSGCGKTSLIKAIAGLWEHGSGNISIPSNIMYIPQKNFIPYLTLKESICYPLSCENITNEKVSQALKLVNLDELTSSLGSIKYWNNILSGGELQKIALAKCFIYQPNWLILDESFSAIDKNCAQKIITNLINLMPKTAILCISHDTWIKQYFPKELILEK